MVGIKRARIERNIITRIYRSLEGRGKFLVSVGQEVTPEEIIGISEAPGGFTAVNIARALGIAPGEVRKYLRKIMGQRIYRGELLAFKKRGFLGKDKVFTCPTDGVLDFVNDKTGEVRISRLPRVVNLPAGVYGIVEALDADMGHAIIRTQISRIHGMCGSGRKRDGVLHILEGKENLLQTSLTPQIYNGSILVNEGLIFRESIMVGISNGINGIITGGINAADYKGIAGGRLIFPKKLENDVGISVVICEGFGSGNIGMDIYKELLTYEDKFVTIDGNHAFLNLPSFDSNSMLKIRKTQLPKLEPAVPGELEETYDTEIVELSVGQKVRVVGTSYNAEQGAVMAINKSKTMLPSGVWAYLATITTSRRKIQVPTTNIEVL